MPRFYRRGLKSFGVCCVASTRYQQKSGLVARRKSCLRTPGIARCCHAWSKPPMSRFPQKLCAEGSLRWVQWFVNHAPHVLDEQIGLGPIDWRSPLREDDYAEYRGAAFLERIGMILERRPLESFWPRG